MPPLTGLQLTVKDQDAQRQQVEVLVMVVQVLEQIQNQRQESEQRREEMLVKIIEAVEILSLPKRIVRDGSGKPVRSEIDTGA